MAYIRFGFYRRRNVCSNVQTFHFCYTKLDSVFASVARTRAILEPKVSERQTVFSFHLTKLADHRAPAYYVSY